jgi:WD40 repeat protein
MTRDDYFQLDLDSTSAIQSAARSPLLDWGEAPDVSIFDGRQPELTQLAQWVSVDRCKLVAILGMGGIGKTALVTKLAQQLQPHFTTIVWRSLRNAPRLTQLLPELIQIYSHQLELVPPTLDSSAQISCLLHQFQQERCLLILDNAEAILSPDSSSPEFAGYTELFRRIGEAAHQSCLLLTSREKPVAIVALEGANLPVRTLGLRGLNADESQYLFDRKGLAPAATDRARLREIYSGNPLILNIVATSICDLFDGEIAEFLAAGHNIFSGIRQLLDRQFDRLSPAEQAVMYWLAIEREWRSLGDLHAQILPATTKSRLLATLESLSRKSLIEHSRGEFTQQAVVMEYMTERLIERGSSELIGAERSHNLPLWLSYPLMAAQSPAYIQSIQTRLILEPIATQLQLQFGSKLVLAQHLQSILASLKIHYPDLPHYGGGNMINLCRYLQIDLTGWDFSDLPIWQADLQGAELHDVNFSGADFAKSIVTRTFGWVSTVAFSPDSQTLATGEYRGDLCLWQISDKCLIHKFIGHTNWIWSIAFSPDGQILATASQDTTVRLWEVATGRVIHILQVDNYHVVSLCFDPAGQLLATGHGNGEMRLWDVLTGSLISSQTAHLNQIFSVKFSPDGRLLATGSDDRTVKIWDVTRRSSGMSLQRTLTTHHQRVWSVRFSPDGKLLATGSSDGTVQLWDIATWAVIDTFPVYANWLFSIGFSPNSQMLAIPNSQNQVNIWAMSRVGGTEPRVAIATLHGHQALVSALQFSPDGKLLATASADRSIRLWDTRTWQELYLWQGYNNWVSAVTFSPAGTQIVSGTQDGIVRRWDVQTGNLLQAIAKHRRGLLSVAYSPDGRSLASASSDGTVSVWSPTGALLHTLCAQHGVVWTVRFSPNSRLIASSSLDNAISIWATTGELITTLIGHPSLVKSIAFSPDSQLLATGSFDACWRLWDLATSQMLGCYTGHTHWVWDLAFSPNGQRIVTCSADRTARLWDVATGQLIQTFTGHTDEVMTVAFSPNGRQFATGSSDLTIKIWDIELGISQTLTGHLGRVLSVSYSPDGQRLVSGSADETLKLWDLTTGDCLWTGKPLPPYAGMKITGATGITPATIDSLKILGAIEI